MLDPDRISRRKESVLSSRAAGSEDETDISLHRMGRWRIAVRRMGEGRLGGKRFIGSETARSSPKGCGNGLLAGSGYAEDGTGGTPCQGPDGQELGGAS